MSQLPHCQPILLSFVLLISSHALAGVEDGLVAYFPFDGNAMDMSGYSNNGTVVGASLVADRHGRAECAYSFDGYNDYIHFTNNSVRNLQSHTVSLWVQRSGAGTESPRLFQNGTVNSSITISQLYLTQNTLHRLGSEWSRTLSTTSTPLSVEWALMTFTYDGAYLRTYRNGVQIADMSVVYTIPTANGILGYVGGDPSPSCVQGALDDVRIYNRALTAGEVMQLFLGVESGICITSAPGTVGSGVASVVIAGTNSVELPGGMWVSNALNKSVQAVTPGADWVTPPVPVEYGVNPVYVQGLDATGGLHSDVVGITREPVTPANVAASDGTFTDRIMVSWAASAGSAAYALYRNTTNVFETAAAVAMSITNLYYNDTPATPGKRYYYWVRAQQNGAWSQVSAGDSGYSKLGACNVTATAGTYTNRVQLAWTGTQGASSYTLYRWTNTSEAASKPIATGMTVMNYVDTNAVPGQLYYYWVRAACETGVGDFGGRAGGYAMLVVDLTNKKMWKLKDGKKDVLTGKKIPIPFANAFNDGWNYFAVKDLETGAFADGPHVLLSTDKKMMKWSYDGANAKILFKDKRKKKTGEARGTLVYKLTGDMPRVIGIYISDKP